MAVILGGTQGSSGSSGVLVAFAVPNHTRKVSGRREDFYTPCRLVGCLLEGKQSGCGPFLL